MSSAKRYAAVFRLNSSVLSTPHKTIALVTEYKKGKYLLTKILKLMKLTMMIISNIAMNHHLDLITLRVSIHLKLLLKIMKYHFRLVMTMLDLQITKIEMILLKS